MKVHQDMHFNKNLVLTSRTFCAENAVHEMFTECPNDAGDDLCSMLEMTGRKSTMTCTFFHGVPRMGWKLINFLLGMGDPPATHPFT